jgi:hypothetical protein
VPLWAEAFLGLAPRPVPPHAFALDRARLRYAAFAREGGDLRLMEARQREVPAETFAPGLLGGPARDGEALERLVGELVADLAAPVREASLVLPDAWLRLAFAEIAELPRAQPAREEVLRWKLRRLVPFRVDELRVAASEVEPLPAQEEPGRLLLGFALEQLLAQLEDAFAAAGVRLGLVLNSSLAFLHALRARPADGLDALVVVDGDGQALLFARADQPVLHRYKPVDAGAGEAADGDGRLVVRDLRLTLSFLGENLPGVDIQRVLLLAPPALETLWLEWLRAGLGRPGLALEQEHVRLAGDPGPAWREAVPLIGAACVEVR